MSTPTLDVSWDTRPVFAKRRRAELERFCNHHSISFPVSCPKDTQRLASGQTITGLLDRIEAAGFNLNEPNEFFKWSAAMAQDEYGNVHQHIEPVTEPHESARLQANGQSINYDKIIAERAEAVAEAAESKETAEQQETLLLRLASKVEALEANSLPLTSMSPPQLKGIAKRRGLDIGGRKTKVELIELLEG